MKRLIFLNVIFTLFFSVYAEKIVNVGGKNIKTQMVDSARFDIRGTWKIIDQKWFYDDGAINRNKKWNELDKGNAVIISDSLFYACTNSLFCNLIINPIFEKSIDTKFSEEGQFFEQYNDTLLHIGVWSKGDIEQSKKIKEPTSTYDIIVLNNDYVVIAESNSFRYLERVKNSIEGEGWRMEQGYNSVETTDDIRIRISPNQLKNPNGFIKFIFPFKQGIEAGILQLYGLTKKELENEKTSTVLIQKYDNLQRKTIKGYIPLKNLKTNVFSIRYLGDKYFDTNPGKFLWKIVDDTTTVTKKIIVSKATIYITPNTSSKMYLLKGDVVEILQEKDDWLQIRYYGKKTIEGWIKKSDVE